MSFRMIVNMLAIAAITFTISFDTISASPDPGKVENQKRAIYVDHVNACAADWARLLNEWEGNGGGIHGSVWTAREQIEQDKKSKFAKIVRKIWAAQKVRNFDSVVFGHWPISDDAMTEATYWPSRATSGYMASILPYDCAALGAMRPLLWDRMVIRSRHGKRACEPRYVEMPEKLPWDPEPVSSWILYWLFVRIDTPIKRVLVRTSPDMVCFENGRQWIMPLKK